MKVLIVVPEDFISGQTNEPLCALLKEKGSAKGYDVTLATGFFNALRRLTEKHYDIVLMDEWQGSPALLDAGSEHYRKQCWADLAEIAKMHTYWEDFLTWEFSINRKASMSYFDKKYENFWDCFVRHHFSTKKWYATDVKAPNLLQQFAFMCRQKKQEEGVQDVFFDTNIFVFQREAVRPYHLSVSTQGELNLFMYVVDDHARPMTADESAVNDARDRVIKKLFSD